MSEKSTSICENMIMTGDSFDEKCQRHELYRSAVSDQLATRRCWSFFCAFYRRASKATRDYFGAHACTMTTVLTVELPSILMRYGFTFIVDETCSAPSRQSADTAP